MIWYILGGLVLLMVILLCIPVRVEAEYSTESGGRVELRWLFLRRRLYPAAEKPQQPAEPPEAEKPREKKPGGSLYDTLETLYDVLPAIGSGAGHISRRITLRRCRIRLSVTAKDAGDAAIRAGRANALLYALYQAAANLIRVRRFDALAQPDYHSETERGEASAVFALSPAAVLGGGLRFLGGGGAAFLGAQKDTKSGKDV